MTDLVCALTTPFTPSGDLDRSAFRRQLHAVSPHVDAVLVSGTTGEFPALSENERHELFSAALAELGAERVIAHIGAPDTRAAKRVAVDAARSGLSRMAALTPYFLPASADEVRQHFSVLRTAVDGELLAYVYPERTGVYLTPDEYSVLAEQIGIDGVKISGELSHRIAEFVAAAPDTSVYSGNDADLPRVEAAGGAGIISGCSSAFPEAFRDGAAAQEVVDSIGSSVGRIKYAQWARGLCGDMARMAVQPPTTDECAAIDALASRYGTFDATSTVQV